MKKTRILFVCVQNSARSQMAEAWMNHLCGETFEAESAGIEPGVLNTFAIQAMREAGIDISHKSTQGVFDLVRAGRAYHFVVAVCDKSAAERCPVFPGVTVRLDWNFPDPASAQGSDEEKLKRMREVRDMIRTRVNAWCAEMCPGEQAEEISA